jgi:hypothetical protein
MMSTHSARSKNNKDWLVEERRIGINRTILSPLYPELERAWQLIHWPVRKHTMVCWQRKRSSPWRLIEGISRQDRIQILNLSSLVPYLTVSQKSPHEHNATCTRIWSGVATKGSIFPINSARSSTPYVRHEARRRRRDDCGM